MVEGGPPRRGPPQGRVSLRRGPRSLRSQHEPTTQEPTFLGCSPLYDSGSHSTTRGNIVRRSPLYDSVSQSARMPQPSSALLIIERRLAPPSAPLVCPVLCSVLCFCSWCPNQTKHKPGTISKTTKSINKQTEQHPQTN